MQYDNSEGKWQDVISYMIINLDYGRDVYISKDTVVAYVKEDATCEYLEINEVIEFTEFCNWTPRPRPNFVDSDLVFSPAQVTEHHHVELINQHISQDIKERFEELKKKYPKGFSMNIQNICHTNLVTFHVDMGDSPPICKKNPYTLPLKHLQLGSTRN